MYMDFGGSMLFAREYYKQTEMLPRTAFQKPSALYGSKSSIWVPTYLHTATYTSGGLPST